MGKPRKYLKDREISAEWSFYSTRSDGSKKLEYQATNIIVDSIGVYIASMIKADVANLWMAWGSGDGAWDVLPDKGKSLEVVGTTQLVAETYRELLQTIEYLDPMDVCVAGPTDRLEFMGRLSAAENPVAVREFGVFGSATATVNSGLMMNHLIIPLRDRSVSAPLDEFIVRITF